jgi:hypothetical protein
MKPLVFGKGSELTLNADASRGTIRVELLDDHGYRLRGFTAEDAVPIHGDSFHHAVAWKGGSLDRLPPGEYLVRIHLDDAEVFALNLEKH